VAAKRNAAEEEKLRSRWGICKLNFCVQTFNEKENEKCVVGSMFRSGFVIGFLCSTQGGNGKNAIRENVSGVATFG
jgi:hypothetical protein